MALDPLTIARLLMAGGQLAGGLVGMRDRDEDDRGQDAVRQLLAQAQSRNLDQAQAIAGSGAGINPALAQRAALEAVTRADERATTAALAQQAALAERDRDRADRLMGARLGALGAFGSQVLAALAEDDDDDDGGTADKPGEIAKRQNQAAAQAASQAAQASQAASATPSATPQATPGPAAQAAVAAAQQANAKPESQFQTDARGDVSESALAQFLARGASDAADEEGSSKEMMALLENAYGGFDPNAPLFEGEAPTAEQFASTNLGMRSQDIPIQRPGEIESLGRASAFEDGGGTASAYEVPVLDAEGNQAVVDGVPQTREVVPGAGGGTVQDVVDRTEVDRFLRQGVPQVDRDAIKDRVLEEAYREPTAQVVRPVPDVPGDVPFERQRSRQRVDISEGPDLSLTREGAGFEDAPPDPRSYDPNRAQMTPELQARIDREIRLAEDARMREVNRLQRLAQRPETPTADQFFRQTDEERGAKLERVTAEQEQVRRQRAAAVRARQLRQAEEIRAERERRALATGVEDDVLGMSMPTEEGGQSLPLASGGSTQPMPHSPESVASVLGNSTTAAIVRRFGASNARLMFTDPSAYTAQLNELGVPQSQQRELAMLAAADRGKRGQLEFEQELRRMRREEEGDKPQRGFDDMSSSDRYAMDRLRRLRQSRTGVINGR